MSAASDNDRPAGDGPPRKWRHLTILETIGQTPVSTIYRAHDAMRQGEVVLTLWPVGAGGSVDGSHALEEATLKMRVRHHNVAAVYGADQIDGCIGVWTELVKGRTLADILQTDGPFSPREAGRVGLDLCRALTAIHAAGPFRGEIRAETVMRGEGNRTVLMNFGTGSLGVVPLYMAPEMLAGGAWTIAADIYSLGVLLFHLVTNSYPVDGQTPSEILRVHHGGERRHLGGGKPKLPKQFVRTVERALAANPLDRYQTVGAVELTLARFLGPNSASRQWSQLPWRALGHAAVALVFVVTASVVYWRGRGETRTPAAGSAATSTVEAGGSQPYTISVALYRESGGHVRLRSHDRVNPGAELSVEVRTSLPVYVYVVNEHEGGVADLLYPPDAQNITDPLPASTVNRLPGRSANGAVFWKVKPSGVRDHVLIFARPARLSLFEQLLPRLDVNHPVERAPLSEAAVGALRSAGGRAAAADIEPIANGPLALRFSTPLGEGEETVHGLFVRQLTLEKPLR